MYTGQFVRSVSREVNLTFIPYFGSNRNAFYLYMATSAACSSMRSYTGVWLLLGLLGFYRTLQIFWDRVKTLTT